MIWAIPARLRLLASRLNFPQNPPPNPADRIQIGIEQSAQPVRKKRGGSEIRISLISSEAHWIVVFAEG